MRWILFPNDHTRISEMGGKAGALSALNRASLPIPDWFVISGDACLQSLGETGRKVLADAVDASQIQALFQELRPDEEISAGINDAFVKLCGVSGFAAVRSSATDEDGTEHSFAGQLESYLFVRREHALEKVAAVWCSGFGGRLLAYRKQHGLPLAPRPPAVLVQRMVNAEVAGVAFSADPVTGRRGIAVVSAVCGLGTALVSGEANADTWLVDRKGKIIETRIAEKNIAHRAAPDSPEGIRVENLPRAQALLPALTVEQVQAVAGLARQCAAFFGRPQDIEWAIEGGKLYLLQSRPVTSIAGQGDPDGVLNIWDNSNIAESYGGVTTPLTYSFARRAYEEVYRQFCKLMAVPESRISKNAHVFHCMIGLVRGRVYYNLLNWYRVLAMLPGFTVNRRFMEQMMGVKEPLPDELVRDMQGASTADRIRDGINLVRTVTGLVWNHFTLQKQIRNFYARLDHSLRT
ncbi:MAG: PEP/pyruvate-binding domain-containing protein, partial [Chthoniobacteraceae bacterium]